MSESAGASRGGPKLALVTGGAKRLGLEFARALADAGYWIALTYRTSRADADAAVDFLLRRRKNEGGRAAAFRVDFAADGTPHSLFEEISRSSLVSAGGFRLDALVHAASPWIPKPVSEVTLADWEAVFRAGPRAAFFLAQAFAPALRAGRGSILLVSDVAAVKPWPSHVPHAAAKAAINALVRNLSVALAPDIRVNGIAPGIVLPPENMSAETVAKLVAKTPLERRVAIGDLMAMAVAILENRSMTGEVVAVDAGRTVKGD
jgi:pteridine reductase